MELTGLLFLFTCQPTKSSNFSRSGVNVRAHLLRKNYSRNFSSIRSTPLSYKIVFKRLAGFIGNTYLFHIIINDIDKYIKMRFISLMLCLWNK